MYKRPVGSNTPFFVFEASAAKNIVDIMCDLPVWSISMRLYETAEIRPPVHRPEFFIEKIKGENKKFIVKKGFSMSCKCRCKTVAGWAKMCIRDRLCPIRCFIKAYQYRHGQRETVPTTLDGNIKHKLSPPIFHS